MINQTPQPTIQNHFIEGLKTEFTGLNFPANAATDTQNCVYTLIGDVDRRGGINYESNYTINNINVSSVAKCSYRWKNVGGDGQTQMLVEQIGSNLYFYINTNATITNPLSRQLIGSGINIASFQAAGNTNNVALTECQFTDGNGFLIVFHKDCDPFFCTFNSSNNTITPSPIPFQIRDVTGIPEIGVPDNQRPTVLTNEHNYNLTNQGWTQGSQWSGQVGANSGPPATAGTIIGSSWTVPIISQVNTTSITNGSLVSISGSSINGGGFTQNTVILATVTNYVTPFTTMTVTVVSCNTGTAGVVWGIYSGGVSYPNGNEILSITLVNQGFINAWFSAEKSYPANSDIWWNYKDTTGAFNPGLMAANVQQNVSAAPKGTYVLNPWRQQRSVVSGISGLTDIITTTRPSVGAWYQGRVFYAGVNSSQQPSGDEPYYTWTENIYFSQIVVNTIDFGKCYQTNDPTSQNLFAILPSDGGVITIQGCGAIYKLFPLRFGLLVFASNGIWFIGGSQGVGFAANDYTVTKISSIVAISGTSFIDVQGYPVFWNQEGIYQVVPSSQPGSAHSPDIQLDVQNLCLGTILTFYGNIPSPSKIYARGDYDQISYIIQWCYKSTSETSITDRYNYDSILCYNIVTKAFYPYTLPASTSVINDVKWIQNPGGVGFETPVFKYITANGSGITFSEENDFTRYLDFFNENNVGYNYTSYFVTGYTLPGQGVRKIQTPYIYFFTRNPNGTSYTVQGIWDFATSPNSGKYSTVQQINSFSSRFGMGYRRVRIRGRGMVIQIKVSSVQGKPFDLMGWSVWNMVDPNIG